MKPAMYKHEIQRQIKRIDQDLKEARKYRSSDYTNHLIQKRESWEKLLKEADTARIGMNDGL